MSFTDRLLLWFHIGFVIFAIGPVTIATMSTPRYIRARNVGVLRYLSRMTRIFGAASLGVLLFGIIAAQSLHEMSKTWVTASMTLFVVALVLLVLIMRDQHKAIAAVEASLAAAPGAPAVASPAPGGAAPAPGGGLRPARRVAARRPRCPVGPAPPLRRLVLRQLGLWRLGLSRPPRMSSPPRQKRSRPRRPRPARRPPTWPPWNAAGSRPWPAWSA